MLISIKVYTPAYQIKAQPLYTPEVGIAIRIFPTINRLADMVAYMPSLTFYWLFLLPLYFHIAAPGFDPATLGVEAQVLASYATEAS